MYPRTLGFNVLRAWRGLRENPGPGMEGGSSEETVLGKESLSGRGGLGAAGQSLVLGLGQREV